MRATGFNHLSLGSLNMEGSVRFYEQVSGLECIPTYNFGLKTQYMRCGSFHAVHEKARALASLYYGRLHLRLHRRSK